MKRRKFLSFAGGLVALSVVPFDLGAKDYRELKPDAWEAKTIDAATKALYGIKEPIESDQINITIPEMNSSGAKVPIKIETTLDAKTVALFQDANPESAVAVFDVTPYDTKTYGVKIKMAGDGMVMVLVEASDGNIYMAKATTKVAAGGCEG